MKSIVSPLTDVHVVGTNRRHSLDTGTFGSMVEASEFVRVLETRQRLMIGSPEEVAFEMGFIDAEQLRSLAEPLIKSGYGLALMDIADQQGERRG